MLWSYVKQNLIDLGFEESNYLSDAEALSIFCTATNKARRIISGVKPLIDRIDFSQKSLGTTSTELSDGATTDTIMINNESVSVQAGNSATYNGTTYTFNGVTWTSSPLVTYDLKELTLDGGAVKFDRIDSVQRIFNGDINAFSDYTLEQGFKVTMKGSNIGNFTIFYIRRLDNITPDTPDDFDIQMDYEVEHLVPLLAGHYAWLDDDIQKATMYYNEYEQELGRIMARLQQRENSYKMKIVGGRTWH